MPYTKEHTLRIRKPNEFKKGTYTRTRGGKWTMPGSGLINIPHSIDVISAQLPGQTGSMRAVQALRFPKNAWTEGQAKLWVKNHKIDYVSFEPASDVKMSENEILMSAVLPVREYVLDENSEIELISLVRKPAIEHGFVALSDEGTQMEISFAQEDKMTITGPALIPNKLIYRRDKQTGEEYNVFFSDETVRKIAEQYLANSNQHNSNLEHGTQLDGICMSESWIVENSKNDKSCAMGMELPVGTWMVTLKVNDAAIWEKIKCGDIRGFSVEGTMHMLVSEISQDFNADETMLAYIMRILSEIED